MQPAWPLLTKSRDASNVLFQTHTQMADQHEMHYQEAAPRWNSGAIQVTPPKVSEASPQSQKLWTVGFQGPIM